MTTIRVLFLADSQLGLYASFSGMTESEVARYAELGMHILPSPPTEGHEWDARQYEKAVAAANSLRPDLILFGGDMIDDPNSEDQLDDFLAITARLDPEIPVRYAPGNHDIATDTVVPTADSLAAYRAVYGDDYYRFDLGPASFLVLNTVVLDHPEQAPDELERQLAFIEDALTGGAPPIVVGHHPFFVEHLHEDDTYWNLPAARRVPLVERLQASGVRLSIAGHWHRNNVARWGDLEMVTSGPVGYPLGDDPSGFRIVDVGDDGSISHQYLPLDPD